MKKRFLLIIWISLLTSLQAQYLSDNQLLFENGTDSLNGGFYMDDTTTLKTQNLNFETSLSTPFEYTGSFSTTGVQTSKATIGGSLTVEGDDNHIFNYYFGTAGFSNWATIAHKDHANTTEYTMRQNSTGSEVYFNATDEIVFSKNLNTNLVQLKEVSGKPVVSIGGSRTWGTYGLEIVYHRTSVGMLSASDVMEDNVFGKRLYFNGAKENGCPLYITRHNIHPNVSGLCFVTGPNGVVNLGRGGTSNFQEHVIFDLSPPEIRVVSDKRLKTDINPLPPVMSKLNHINGVYFHFKKTPWFKRVYQKKNIGLIAQNVEPQFPSLVSNTNDDTKMVAYSGFIPILIKAYQENQEIYNNNEKQLKDLKKMIKNLKETI